MKWLKEWERVREHTPERSMEFDRLALDRAITTYWNNRCDLARGL